MNKFAFYLDLDGVLADYEAGIRAMGFEYDPELNKSAILLSGTGNAKKREMYDVIKGTRFYANLPVMEHACNIFNEITRIRGNYCFLTAAPKFGSTEEDYYLNPYWLGAAYHKRRWVEEKFLPRAVQETKESSLEITRVHIKDESFICTTSARKWEYINRIEAEYQVLIDDRQANIDDWVNAGGIGILHDNVQSTVQAIKEIEFKALKHLFKMF